MDVVLIPGFWLGADSWRDVVPVLNDAGHTVHALTLPGLDPASTDRGRIGLADQVSAVVATVDALPGPVVLVGHSGGGSVASLAADRRPEHVWQVVYVDSGPLGEGGNINDSLPELDGEVPLPDWSAFDESELRDLTNELRARFRDEAVPEPARVARDRAHLTNVRRYDVPSTIVASTMPAAQLGELIASGHPYVAEFGRMRRRAILDLPTGHWPQFTKPRELGEAIVRALAERP